MAKYYYKRYTTAVSYSNMKSTRDASDKNLGYINPEPTWPLYSRGVSASKVKLDPATGFWYDNSGATPGWETTDGKIYYTSYHVTIASPTLAWCFYVEDVTYGQMTWESVCRYPYDCKISDTYKFTATTNYNAGTYVDEVVADDGTYPDNGKHSDGYWYIKDRPYITFYARINGAWTATEPYVRVNGVWKPADIKPRVNGAWVG